MNESTYDALILGLNIFVFTVALTAGMALMASINQMVEYTKTSIEQQIGGNLVQEYGDEAERTFTGAEVLSFYGQKLNGKLKDYNLYVRAGGAQSEIMVYGKNSGTGYLNRTFIMKCINANTFLFELQP